MKLLLLFIVPFCSVFIGLGGWMLRSAAQEILLGIRAERWPHTTGELLSVESKDNSDSESKSREILVRYAYSVGGQRYENDTIHPSYGSSGLEEAHRGLESLLGSARKVRVYYDSLQPSRSTLSVGFYSSSLSAVAGGLLFLTAGIGFLLLFWFIAMGNSDFARGITVVG